MSVFYKGRKITGGGITINQKKQADWAQENPMEIDFIKNKPAVVQPDWEQTDALQPDFIKHKPAVVQADWDQTDEAQPDYIKHKPAVVQPDWEQTENWQPDFIKNKPNMSNYFTKDEILQLLEGFTRKSDLCFARWVDEDGTELARKEYYAGQAIPTYEGTPTKASTVSHTYTFSGWSEGVTEGNTTTYTAQYTETEKTLYTVIYKDWNGTVLKQETYYDGQNEPSAPANPTRAEDSSNYYAFNTWAKTQDGTTITYTAQYTATEKYTVVWKNGDNSALRTDEFYSQEEANNATYTATNLLNTPSKLGGYIWNGTWTKSWSGTMLTCTPNFTAIYTTKWVGGKSGSNVLETKTSETGYYDSSEIGNDKPAPYWSKGVEWNFDKWDSGSVNNNTRTKTYTAIYTPGGSSGGGGGGCFVAGTLVQTPEGLRPIEDIKIGDKVITFNLSKRVNEPDEVRLVWSGIKDFAMYHISVGEEVISATWNHKMYIKRNGEISWITAEELQVGDMMFNDNHEWIPITAIVQDTQEIVVYDFGCKTNHNFYITTGKYLVHNLPRDHGVDEKQNR